MSRPIATTPFLYHPPCPTRLLVEMILLLLLLRLHLLLLLLRLLLPLLPCPSSSTSSTGASEFPAQDINNNLIINTEAAPASSTPAVTAGAQQVSARIVGNEAGVNKSRRKGRRHDRIEAANASASGVTTTADSNAVVPKVMEERSYLFPQDARIEVNSRRLNYANTNQVFETRGRQGVPRQQTMQMGAAVPAAASAPVQATAILTRPSAVMPGPGQYQVLQSGRVLKLHVGTKPR
jgi:hypothetical protein